MSDLLPISEIAHKLGLRDDDVETYGRHTAKVRLECLPAPGTAPKGKLILVTGITPTSAGEGKTVTTIGLAQALDKLGKKAVATLREPSLGPVFGVKGGATGGGKSQVQPFEKINLHFNGDKHAVTSAHNLLGAMLDAHIFHGNDLGLDLNNISWPRAMDMNDRALRNIKIGLGGKADGVPRDSRFIITAASEIMAVLALAESRADFERRLGEITIGFKMDGAQVRAKELQAVGAMMVLLNETLMPNLVQTTEHTPALIHAGPFANIAHGTSSIIAQRLALDRAEYVVNEAGFASDLGGEKYIDIVVPASGIKPSAAVLVATLKALRRHDSANTDMTPGLENLAKHVDNLRKYHLPAVVGLNRFADDRDADIQSVKACCAELGVEFAVNEVFSKGGAGGAELGEKVITAASSVEMDAIKPLYAHNAPISEKIATVAREVYGADGVMFKDAARTKLDKFAAMGFGHFPVCIAKTQNSLSDDPKKLGAPKGWTLTISDAHLSSGAGFIVCIAGNMLLMPGLGKVPQAVKMSVKASGEIEGLG